MTHPSRRHFLHQVAVGAGWVGATLAPARIAQARVTMATARDRRADELASDEDFWFPIQQAFTVDRSIINFNNGGVSPATGVAMEAMRRHDEYSNHAPARSMWRVLDRQQETVRGRLATLFGCDAEEIAITRNATEGLDNVIFGLDLVAGDEVLTTAHDYPAMLQAFEQREQREKIKLTKIDVPAPAASQEDLYDAFVAAITSRTKVILVSHVVNISGQIFPVERICRLGRERGIEVIVDGAHSFGLLPFTRDSLDCDYFGTSLHKWMNAPIGAGMLYVRKTKIERVWPLYGQGRSDDIRKFESIGTHPVSHRLAIAEAAVFHEHLGPERKGARLRYLRDRWVKRFTDHPKVHFHANLNDVDSCAIATVGVDGMTPSEINAKLWNDHRIVVSPIEISNVRGIRVTPGIYSTLDEVDRFADALERIVAKGA